MDAEGAAPLPLEVVTVSSRARLVVPIGVDDLYSWLHDVANWPQFLEGLEAVEPLGYHRYRWQVTFGRRPGTCDVVVSVDPQEHRFSWRHLAGTPFDGTIRLTPVTEDRTQVDLVVDVKPLDLLDGVVDLGGRDDWMAERDLQRLRDVVAARGALRRDGEAV